MRAGNSTATLIGSYQRHYFHSQTVLPLVFLAASPQRPTFLSDYNCKSSTSCLIHLFLNRKESLITDGLRTNKHTHTHTHDVQVLTGIVFLFCFALFCLSRLWCLGWLHQTGKQNSYVLLMPLKRRIRSPSLCRRRHARQRPGSDRPCIITSKWVGDSFETQSLYST